MWRNEIQCEHTFLLHVKNLTRESLRITPVKLEPDMFLLIIFKYVQIMYERYLVWLCEDCTYLGYSARVGIIPCLPQGQISSSMICSTNLSHPRTVLYFDNGLVITW